MKTSNINIRVEPKFLKRLKRMAAHKKWALTTYIQEAMELKVIEDEELLAATKKS